MPPKDFVQPRRGTAAEWAAKTPSPVLKLGELGVETDTHRMKIGDGVTAWSSLGYIAGTFDLDNVPVQQLRDTDANLSALTDPFLSGQLVYGQTTGKTVIGDGESLFDELPDLRKQFKNVVTVAKSGKRGSADFICSDSQWSGSDAACIQAALDSTSNGNTIRFLEGDYTLTSYVHQTGKDLNIIGDGNVNFYLNTPSSDPFEGFYFGGTTVTASGSIAENASSGSYTIIMSDGPVVKPGDLIKIWNGVQWCPNDYPSYTMGEMYLVKNVNGNTLTLSEPLIRNYNIIDTINFAIYRPIKIHTENINVYDDGSTDPRLGFSYQYCKDSSIKNSYFYGSGMSCVSVYSCYNVEIAHNRISTAIKEGSGYGITAWNASAYIDIHHNMVDNCRHCISGNSTELHALVRNVYIHDNICVGSINTTANVIDAHPVVYDYYVYNNVIYPTPGNFGFIDGSLISEFYGNKIYGGNGAVIRRGNLNGGIHKIYNNYTELQATEIIAQPEYAETGYTGTYFAANSGVGDRIEIYNNKQYGGNYGVAFKYNEAFNNTIIKDNFFNQIYYQGIYIKNSQNNLNLYISNNDIRNCRLGGIILDGSTYSNRVVDITNNILDNTWSDTAAGTRGAIIISSISNAKIEQNTIKDVNGNYRYCIYESAGCNSNSISRNDVSGYTIGGIYKTGALSKIKDNPGHITENTGTATISTSQTSVTISHGLVAAPTRYSVTPSANVGNCWIDTITSTQMTINCSTAPEADIAVSWSAQVV